MFKNVSDFMREGPTLELDLEGQPNERDLQLATLALLVSLAQSHAGFSEEELKRIMTVMFEEFGLEETQGGELLEIAEFMLKEEGKLEKFISSINDCFNPEQRQRVLTLVWRIVMADGVADQTETAFATDLRKKLNLTLEQAVRARQMAQAPKAATQRTAAAEEDES